MTVLTLPSFFFTGAYTCQLCSIDPNHGDSLIWLLVINSSEVIELPETITWYNNYTITNGTSTLVDGAKRDRLVCKRCPGSPSDIPRLDEPC